MWQDNKSQADVLSVKEQNVNSLKAVVEELECDNKQLQEQVATCYVFYTADGYIANEFEFIFRNAQNYVIKKNYTADKIYFHRSLELYVDQH